MPLCEWCHLNHNGQGTHCPGCRRPYGTRPLPRRDDPPPRRDDRPFEPRRNDRYEPPPPRYDRRYDPPPRPYQTPVQRAKRPAPLSEVEREALGGYNPKKAKAEQTGEHPSARGSQNINTVQVQPEICLGIATWNVNHFGQGDVDDTALARHLALTHYALDLAPPGHLAKKLRRSLDRFQALCEQLSLVIKPSTAEQMQKAFNARYSAARGPKPPRKPTRFTTLTKLTKLTKPEEKPSMLVEEPEKSKKPKKPPPPGLKHIFPPGPKGRPPLLTDIQVDATEPQKKSLAYWIYDNCAKPMNVELKKRAVALSTAKLFYANDWLDVLIVQEVNSFADFQVRVRAALKTLGLDGQIGIQSGPLMQSVGKKNKVGQQEYYPILHRLKRTRYKGYFLLEQDGSVVTSVDGQGRRWFREGKLISSGPAYRWDKHEKKTYRPVVVHQIEIAALENRWQKVHIGVVHTTPGTEVGEREFDRIGEYAQIEGALKRISERVDKKNEWWVIGGDFYLLDEALVERARDDKEKELWERAILEEEEEKKAAYHAKGLSLPPLAESIVKTERVDYIRNAALLTFKFNLPENLRIAAAVTGSNWHAPALLWDGPDAYVAAAREARREGLEDDSSEDSGDEGDDDSGEGGDGDDEVGDEDFDEELRDDDSGDALIIDGDQPFIDGGALIIDGDQPFIDGGALIIDGDQPFIDGDQPFIDDSDAGELDIDVDVEAEELADARARAAYFATARVADFFVGDTNHWTRRRVGLFNPYWDGGGIVLADSEGTLECSTYWSYQSDHFPIGGMFLGGRRFNLDSIVSTVTEARAAAAWLDRFRLASRFSYLHRRVTDQGEAARILPEDLNEKSKWTDALCAAVTGFDTYRKQRTGDKRVWSDPDWPGAQAFAEGDRTMAWALLCEGIVVMETFLMLPEKERMQLTTIEATYFGVEGLKGLNAHFEEDEPPVTLGQDPGNPSVVIFLREQARGDKAREQTALDNFFAKFLLSKNLALGASTAAHHDCLLHTFIQLEEGVETKPDRKAFARLRRRIKLPASGMTEIGGLEVLRWLRARKICVRLWALNIDGTVKLYTIGPDEGAAKTWNVLYYGAHYIPLWPPK